MATSGFRKLLGLLGLDRAILFGVGTKAWGAVAGVTTIALVGTLLSKATQGYFYTFSSLLALQSFFEMGTATVVSYFTAHEFAHLRWGPRGELLGDAIARQRVLDLLRRSALWFSAIALAFVAIVLPLGYGFFAHPAGPADTAVPWQWPWLAAVLATASNLALTPFMAVLNGSGAVAQVNRTILVGRMTGAVASWLALFSHHGLYAVALSLLGTAGAVAVLLLRERPELLRALRESPALSEHRISLRREVWPMQWRIAISWFAGFFIFQLFNPLLFHYRGPVEAGRFGMTLAAANTIFGVGITWINARAPDLARTIATREWMRLDRMFFAGLWRAISITALGSTAFMALLLAMQGRTPFATRFLPPWQVAVLLAAITVNITVDALATYLRAHKQEVFPQGAVITGVLQASISWWGVRAFGTPALVLCFFGVYSCYCLPVSIYFWRRKRREWHGPTAQ
jgi:hypothetical protein